MMGEEDSFVCPGLLWYERIYPGRWPNSVGSTQSEFFTRKDSKKMGTQGMGNRDTSRLSSGLVKIMFSANGYRRLPECFEIKSFENIDTFRSGS